MNHFLCQSKNRVYCCDYTMHEIQALLDSVRRQQSILLNVAFSTDQNTLVAVLHNSALKNIPETLSTLEIIQPEKASLGIEVVRDLQEQLRYAATAQRPRWIALLQADTLTVAAQNALLKILEEPPPNTILILVTARYTKLLPTITSRTLHLTETELKTVLNIQPVETLPPELCLQYTDIKQLTIAQACEKAEEFSDKQAALDTTQQLLTEIHAKIVEGAQENSALSHQYQTLLKHAQSCVLAVQQLEANCNVKLVMGELLLGIVKR